FCFFFFSSRRRHTRFSRDWSSDVCSSDLDFILAAELRGMKRGIVFRYIARNAILPLFTILALSLGTLFGGSVFIEKIFNYPGLEIGRASCRERVQLSGVVGSVSQKHDDVD